MLAITNSLHGILWTASVTDAGVQFTLENEHFWVHLVQTPFAYGLFGFSLVALAGRLPSIARAHRHKVLLLLVCAVLPFSVTVANAIFGFGPEGFPFTAATMVVLLPLYWWASVALRVYDFTPLAYQTLFDHVRDAIIVLDRSERIISANHPAQKLLGATERALMGQRLWEDLPEAREVLKQPTDGDHSPCAASRRCRANRMADRRRGPFKGPS